jgi:hypothetical protein
MNTVTEEPKVATPEEAEQALDGLKEKLDKDAVTTAFEGAKSPRRTVDLPGGGYVDDAGKMHSRAVLREMTGREEDILTDLSMPPGLRLDTLISNCIESFLSEDGTSVTDHGVIALAVKRNLPTVDRILLVIRLRQLSIGEDFSFKVECPGCEVELDKFVSLQALEVQAAPEPSKRVYVIDLPSGRKARWRIPTGVQETDFARVSSKNTHNTMTRALEMRVFEVNGEPSTFDVIRNLSARDRSALRKDFVVREGSIDTSIDVVCEHCAHKFHTEVAVASVGFFFPTRG